MQEPNSKKIPSYVPEFIRVGLSLAIADMYDGKVFDDFPGACQRCGSRDCMKNGCDDVLFAKLISPEGGFVDVRVRLQNHLCNDCGKPYLSHGPFYKGAAYGAPIVDMALMLSMDCSSYAVERAMMNFGIQLSEDTVLDYTRLFAERAKELAPLIKGQGEGLYAINMLKVLFGVENARELKEKLPDVTLESLSDEVYLRKKGALRKILEEVAEGRKKLVHRGAKGDIAVEKDEDGREKASFPESFTLALSYLPGAEAYASLLCTKQSFNTMLANMLFKALEGTSFNMTDGSKSYNEVKNRVLDPVHRTRNELKHDSRFKEMRKELKEEKEKVEEAKNEEEKNRAVEGVEKKIQAVTKYAKAKYQKVLGSTIEQVRREHPELFDENGSFRGRAMTSNGAEGGNWRLKYHVRVAHSRVDTSTGKSALAAIKDSVFTVRGVKIRESFANKVGFVFGGVMAAV